MYTLTIPSATRKPTPLVPMRVEDNAVPGKIHVNTVLVETHSPSLETFIGMT